MVCNRLVMSSVTNTNVRVGPGVYLALKQLSDNSKMSMGAWANFFIIMSFTNLDKDQKIIKSFSPEIQSALTADMMNSFSELFKSIGFEAVKNTNLSEIYQQLLHPKSE